MSDSNNNQAISKLINDLSNDDGIVRLKARHELIKIGKEAIDYLVKLKASPLHTTRWEAVKAIGQIEDPAGIPRLIDALQDSKFDVRWLAAEGLIRLGEKVVPPLMEALIKEKGSVFLLEGVHHVLKELEFENQFVDRYDIISKLECCGCVEPVQLAAEKILDSAKE